MVRAKRRQAQSAGTVARPARTTGPTPKIIGFIGKADITDYEAACLTYIGRCLANLGHTLLIVPAKGATSALRVGVEMQGGKVREVETGIIDQANRTLVYPDPNLTQRLEQAYPDLHDRDDVVIITESQLDEWIDAMKSILAEYGVNRP